MTLVTAASFKTQVAAMAAALTIAWSDTVKTEVAIDVRNPNHPLRQFKKFFVFNAATGVVSADDGYVDAAYAGLFPSKGNGLDKVADYAVTFVSAAVADLTPTIITLTFSEDILGVENLSVAGTVTTPKAISSVSLGTTVVITVDSAYIATDTITVSGRFRGVNGGYVTLAAQAVTNNVT